MPERRTTYLESRHTLLSGKQSLITMKLEQEKGFLVEEEAVNIPILEKTT